VSFRLLPHTADLRGQVEGPDRRGLYAEAVAMMRSIFVGRSDVAPIEQRPLAAGARPEASGDPAERFLAFLKELVFLYDTEGFLPAGLTPDGAAVTGEIFDARRHESHHQLKAVTRHAYSYAEEPGRCRAAVVFDV
jgi:SHS2 domain-containing protein